MALVRYSRPIICLSPPDGGVTQDGHLRVVDAGVRSFDQQRRRGNKSMTNSAHDAFSFHQK